MCTASLQLSLPLTKTGIIAMQRAVGAESTSQVQTQIRALDGRLDTMERKLEANMNAMKSEIDRKMDQILHLLAENKPESLPTGAGPHNPSIHLWTHSGWR